MSFERSDSWYEPDEDNQCDQYDCPDCEIAGGDLLDVKTAVQELIGHLYTASGKLDLGMIDDAIGRICDAVSCTMPDGLPKIQRQDTEIFKFMRALTI